MSMHILWHDLALGPFYGQQEKNKKSKRKKFKEQITENEMPTLADFHQKVCSGTHFKTINVSVMLQLNL